MPDEPRRGPGAPRLPGWLPLLVVAAAWLGQGRVLQHGWVLDDARLVRDNPALVSSSGPSAVLAADAWREAASPNAWRPVAVASLALEARFWSDAEGRIPPFGFHVTNLFLHGLNGVLLLFLLAALFPTRPLVVGGAALAFVLHPVQVATVSPLVGRADLLALLFSLLAVRLWMAADRRPALFPLAALAWLFALLSKETALGLPLVLGLTLVARRGGPTGLPRWAGAAALAGALAVWLLARPVGLPAPAAPAAAFVTALAHGTVALLLPVGLVRDPMEGLTAAGGAQVATILLAAVVVGGILAATVRARAGGRIAPVVAAAGLSFLVMTALAVLVSPSGAERTARFTYVTAAGLFLVAGLAVEALVRMALRARTRMAPVAAGAGLVALAASFLVLSWTEARAWADDEAYHRGLLERYPDRAPLFVRLARRWREESEGARALAIALPADDPRTSALDQRAREQLAQAWEWAQRARALDGELQGAWREVAATSLAAGDAHVAHDAIETALSLDPWLGRGDPDAVPVAARLQLAEDYALLGRASQALGNAAKAAQSYVVAAQLDPASAQRLHQAGSALLRARRLVEGAERLERAAELSTRSEERELILRDLQAARRAITSELARVQREAIAAEERGRHRDAVALWERAMQLEPRDVRSHVRAAYLRGVYFGAYQRAFGYLDQAVEALDALGSPPEDPDRDMVRKMRKTIEDALAAEPG